MLSKRDESKEGIIASLVPAYVGKVSSLCEIFTEKNDICIFCVSKAPFENILS